MTEDNEKTLQPEDLVKEEEKVSPQTPLPKEEESDEPSKASEEQETNTSGGVEPVPENFGIDKYQMLNVSDIEFADWNPNEQDAQTFNILVDSIREDGFVEPVQVIPVGDKFRVIGGEHRVKAVRTLGWKQIPAVILKEYTEDTQKFLTVRMNVLKGKLNPIKLNKLAEQYAKKYGQDQLAKLFGMNDPKALNKVYSSIRKQMPEELKKKLDESKKEVKTIDDLSNVLNEIFRNYGSSVPYNFIYFTFGGKKHVLIQSNKKTFETLSGLLKVANQKNVDANIPLHNLIKKWEGNEDIWEEK